MRAKIVEGFRIMNEHEGQLTKRFLEGIKNIPSLKLYGNSDPKSTLEGKRTPTFAMRMNRFKTAGELAEALVDRKIVTAASHFYAKYFSEGLDLDKTGGYVRIGFAHYNTFDEIDKVLEALKEIEGQFPNGCNL